MLIVGASFTAVTVSTKLRVAVKPPASVTVTVIVLAPLALATGLSVIVRLVYQPSSTIPLVATTPWFDDVAVTTSESQVLSKSPNVNGIAPVAVFSSVV